VLALVDAGEAGRAALAALHGDELGALGDVELDLVALFLALGGGLPGLLGWVLPLARDSPGSWLGLGGRLAGLGGLFLLVVVMDEKSDGAAATLFMMVHVDDHAMVLVLGVFLDALGCLGLPGGQGPTQSRHDQGAQIRCAFHAFGLPRNARGKQVTHQKQRARSQGVRGFPVFSKSRDRQGAA